MISSLENYRKSRQEVMEENIRTSILDNVEVTSFKSKSKGLDPSTLQTYKNNDQLGSVQETPKQIRQKMLKEKGRQHSMPEQLTKDEGPNTDRSRSSAISSQTADCPACPKVYEEIIQKLEADIRKHIRIEHQLKLHIESSEDRIEELEREMDIIDATMKTKPRSSSGSKDFSKDNSKELSKLKEENTKLAENIKELKESVGLATLKEESLHAQITSLSKEVTEKKQSIQNLNSELGTQKQRTND